MKVRVLHIEIQAAIGDGVLRPVAMRALLEYFNSRETGMRQQEVFSTKDGVKITVNHYYRDHIA